MNDIDWVNTLISWMYLVIIVVHAVSKVLPRFDSKPRLVGTLPRALYMKPSGRPLIVGSRVVSPPGSAVKITEYDLSEEAQAGLSTGGVRIPPYVPPLTKTLG